MNDKQRKLLTEYLGECWHELLTDSDFPAICSCGKGISTNDHHNRTFTTPDDLHALVCRMVERVDWLACHSVLRLAWLRSEQGDPLSDSYAEYTAWLITYPARTCQLIAEWMEHERKDIE